MRPAVLSVGKPLLKPVFVDRLISASTKPPLPVSGGSEGKLFGRLLLGVGVLCLPLLVNSARAADADTSAPISAQDAQSLREELRQLREEVKALKGASTTNAATIQSVSDKIENNATRSDLEALRDVEEEHILRSVGSSSSVSPFTVSGNQHLVNLSGSAQVGFSSASGAKQEKTTKSFKLNSVSLALSGNLRKDPGQEGDVRYNVGITGTSSFAASDVWVAYDIKTTKLELEPAWTLTLQAGQFNRPYGIEAVSTEANRPTINQAQFVSKLGFSGRDIGVTATGGIINRNDPSATTVPLINYTLGVFNGAGANTVDSNTGADFLGRLALNPFYRYADNFRNLTFGANIYEGNTGAITSDSKDNLPTKRRFGGDIQWLRKPFLFTVEYLHSEDGFDGRSAPLVGTGVTPTASFAKSDSYTATLFWTPGTLADFQPWIRYDFFDPTAFKDYTGTKLSSANAAGNGNTPRSIYSVGFNWFIWSLEPVTRRTYATSATQRVLKLQTSYSRTEQEGSQASAYTGAKDQIDVALTFSF